MIAYCLNSICYPLHRVYPNRDRSWHLNGLISLRIDYRHTSLRIDNVIIKWFNIHGHKSNGLTIQAIKCFLHLNRASLIRCVDLTRRRRVIEIYQAVGSRQHSIVASV